MDFIEEQKQHAKNTEILRLISLMRNGSESGDLLEDALDGQERTVANVTRMFNFYVGRLGSAPSWRRTGCTIGQDIVTPLWNVCAAYFQSEGLTAEQIQEIRCPKPVPGPSIFDDMEE